MASMAAMRVVATHIGRDPRPSCVLARRALIARVNRAARRHPSRICGPGPPIGDTGLRHARGAKPAAVVATVTAAVAVPDVPGVRDAGEKLQLTPGGGAVQASVMPWLNPPMEVAVIV